MGFPTFFPSTSSTRHRASGPSSGAGPRGARGAQRGGGGAAAAAAAARGDAAARAAQCGHVAWEIRR